jgi:hypothetical protein
MLQEGHLNFIVVTNLCVVVDYAQSVLVLEESRQDVFYSLSVWVSRKEAAAPNLVGWL